jgi:hypothetical protein
MSIECLLVSGHFKPASNGRNDPATLICVSRHFPSNQTRRNSLVSGLFERKMPLFSSHLMQDSLAGSFRPSVAGLISTDDICWAGQVTAARCAIFVVSSGKLAAVDHAPRSAALFLRTEANAMRAFGREPEGRQSAERCESIAQTQRLKLGLSNPSVPITRPAIPAGHGKPFKEIG